MHNKHPPLSALSESVLPDDFNGGFMHVIHLFYLSIQKRLETALVKSNEISFSQFLVLVGFSCKEHLHFTQAKLAEHLMLTEATISRHTRTLVTLGLLTKEKDITNKKSYNLKLTSAGVNAFTRAKKVIMKELDVSFSHITQVDKKIIMSNFTKSTSLLQ